MNEVWLRRKLEEFLLEDLGYVEVNAEDAREVTAQIIAESEGVFCGGVFIGKLFEFLRPEGVHRLDMRFLLSEGSQFRPGDTLAMFCINAEILRASIRTALNLLQHLSGIATNTRRMAAELHSLGYPAKLLDTRKTTPGLRVFEKYAVRVGGGVNHRFGRFDGILIKKEDIKVDGNITAAIDRAFESKPHLVAVEIEVETLGELELVIADGRVKYILLDNMDYEAMRKAVRRSMGKDIALEASGVGEKDIRAVAETGVHYISLSSLIRGVCPIKMKMRIVDS